MFCMYYFGFLGRGMEEFELYCDELEDDLVLVGGWLSSVLEVVDISVLEWVL